MHLKEGFLFLLACIAVEVLGNNASGQELYSYLDENGVQVYTNIPPVGYEWSTYVRDPMHAPLEAGNPVKKSNPATAIDSIIEKYAREYELDPSLIRSMIATESGFDPKAVSPKGALGLMQLMPSTAERLGVSNPFDPDQNIRGGAQHFRSLLNSFDNNLILSLAAYNAGENLVQRLGRVPEIRETHNYIHSVTKRYGKKELEANTEEEEATRAQMFRFVDEDGVLHLTNIPPAR